MAYTRDKLMRSVDWTTIIIYLLLLAAGWLSVCGASYEYGQPDFFSFNSRAGKQLVWINLSLVLGFVILKLDEKIYDWLAYIFYAFMMLVLFVTPFMSDGIKGSYSWIKLGSVSIQPAEFAKFVTALALAKFISRPSFTMRNARDAIISTSLILLPMLLIIMQRETGSALVYSAFFLMLYREGMSGFILFSGIISVVYFVIGIRFAEVMMPDGATPVGEYAVLLLIAAITAFFLNIYQKKKWPVFTVLGINIGGAALMTAWSTYVSPFDVSHGLYIAAGLTTLFLIWLWLKERVGSIFYISLFTLGSVLFLYSADYAFERILEPHQKVRINVVLGLEDDPSGAGYNVNQSKIAIGSGGFAGKGFLAGTQTKLKYVPEQDTDFIFCTIGEEQGFLGSVAVLILFTILILRLIYLSERQRSRFARVYGYSVLSIFFFHLFINIGMVLGLTPVIGIPLPFFSYGGSSLWGFSILLFIFLRLDASR